MRKLLSSQAKGSLRRESAVPVQMLQRCECALASTSTTAWQLCTSQVAGQLGALTALLLGTAPLLLGKHCETAAPALQAACTAASAVVGYVDLSKVTSRTPAGRFSAMRPSWRCFAMAT
jgi:hypothetical protein